MTNNKNQHFVPRCHLRPFTVDGQGRAINLFNLDFQRSISAAPVKNQCSRDYFYGDDASLESAINFVENGYASALRHLLGGVKRVEPGIETVLRLFIYLQHLRTEAAARAAAEMTFAMYAVPGIDEPVPTFKEAVLGGVQAAMLAYADTMRLVDDLRVCVVRNRSRVPFITSDNPVVLTNRWHLGNARTQGRGFGAKSAGIIFIMPLSSDMLAIVYDADVNSIAHRSGLFDLTKDIDAHALNEHQILNCAANLYFRDWAQRETIAVQTALAISSRPNKSHHVHYAVLDKKTEWGTRYEVRDLAAIEPGQEVLVHTIAVHPAPSRWPSFLKLRRNGRVYSNGTGAGFIRYACLARGFVTGRNYRELKV